jgi:hypothetical protein
MNYRLNESEMFADISDNIAIVINSATGIYYGMNPFATNVYENIINGANTDDILTSLKAINGVPGDIEQNFNKFINEMVAKNILLETNPSNASVNINTELAKNDNFVFEFKEYDDAQELLLADPIHEVKEETGWTPEKESIGYSKEETKEREQKLEA